MFLWQMGSKSHVEKSCPMLKNCSGPQVVTPVVWNKPDVENSVPLWIIILAILAGLLLLALLIYVLYKVSDVRLPVSHNPHLLSGVG